MYLMRLQSEGISRQTPHAVYMWSDWHYRDT